MTAPETFRPPHRHHPRDHARHGGGPPPWVRRRERRRRLFLRFVAVFGLIALLAAVVMALYPLNQQKMDEISAELDARRASEHNAGS